MSLTSSRIVPSENAFAINPARSGGLVLHVCGGYLLGGPNFTSVPNATLTLSDNTVNYVELSAIGAIVSNTTAFTDGAIFLYRVTTLAGAIIEIEDWRANPGVPPPGVPVFQKTVTLTDAQIKALPTVPVQIVAAPGAGKMIVLIWGVFSCDTTAGDYSHFNNSATVNPSPFSSSIYFALDAADNFNDASGPVVAGRSDASGGILTGTRRSVAIVNGVSGGLMGVGPDASFDQGEAGGASLGYENADLSIVGQNDNLGNFQGGHADNTMTVTVGYAVVDV